MWNSFLSHVLDIWLCSSLLWPAHQNTCNRYYCFWPLYPIGASPLKLLIPHQCQLAVSLSISTAQYLIYSQWWGSPLVVCLWHSVFQLNWFSAYCKAHVILSSSFVLLQALSSHPYSLSFALCSIYTKQHAPSFSVTYPTLNFATSFGKFILP